MKTNKNHYDAIIIGAGAAGLICAIESGKRGRKTLLIDHSKKIGEKIRISGGGRCNFTNLHTRPAAYISQNPHFCKSALKQFTQNDFIALIEKHGIAWHEKDNSGKKLGQLFCNESAQHIIDMLLKECETAHVTVKPETTVETITHKDDQYQLQTTIGALTCESLVIATGGLSIPKIGASKFGYDIARQFGINIVETRPALVPLTFQTSLLEFCKTLSGVSLEVTTTCGKHSFTEGLVFTHRGLSGPAILQISSYWNEGDAITINLAPNTNALDFLKTRKTENPKQNIETALSHILPARLADQVCETAKITGRLADLSDKKLITIASAVNDWTIKPAGTEGYRTAEVTLHGIDTNDLSSKTMECKNHPGLFFIGEVVDVTGHLGGYNFQWAWSSGYAAGRNV